MTMLEKMARAMCVASGIDPDRKGNETDWRWQEWLPEARAALLAIREPDARLADAVEPSYSNPYGSEGPYGGGPFGDARPPIADIWRDMIDAILNEGTPAGGV